MSQQAVLLEKEWTLEEWLSLPEGPPYYELEGGKLLLMPSPRREHQQITGRGCSRNWRLGCRRWFLRRRSSMFA